MLKGSLKRTRNDASPRRDLVGRLGSHYAVQNKRVRGQCWYSRTTLSTHYTSTYVAVPLTTNLRRAALPSCVRISRGEGGLASDSVALCHQMRVLDQESLVSQDSARLPPERLRR